MRIFLTQYQLIKHLYALMIINVMDILKKGKKLQKYLNIIKKKLCFQLYQIKNS